MARARSRRGHRAGQAEILRSELEAGSAEPSRRSACRTRALQCIWTDRVSAKTGGRGGGVLEREREGEEKTVERHEGNAGKDEAEREGEERSRKLSRGGQGDMVVTEKEAEPEV